MRVTRLGWHTVNILARSHQIITRTMSHCLPSKGTVLRLFNIVVQWKVSFSHAHLAHVGHKALANFFFVVRIFRSRIGDSRRRAATFGDSRRQSTTIGDCRNVHERKRSKKSAPLGFHNSVSWMVCIFYFVCASSKYTITAATIAYIDYNTLPH